MKKVSLEQTLIRVVGRQETVVQKHRVKTLDGDWNVYYIFTLGGKDPEG